MAHIPVDPSELPRHQFVGTADFGSAPTTRVLELFDRSVILDYVRVYFETGPTQTADVATASLQRVAAGDLIGSTDAIEIGTVDLGAEDAGTVVELVLDADPENLIFDAGDRLVIVWTVVTEAASTATPSPVAATGVVMNWGGRTFTSSD